MCESVSVRRIPSVLQVYLSLLLPASPRAAERYKDRNSQTKL